MEQETIIAVSCLGGASLLLLVLVAVLFSQLAAVRRRLDTMQHNPLRVQKATLDNNDKNHAFHNPAISPDEELARRGFSMYAPDDAESGRLAPTERQTGGQLLEELTQELDYRHSRQQNSLQQNVQQQNMQQQNVQEQRSPSPPRQPPQQQREQAPPFLLQSIEQSKARRHLANPVANNGRTSETNPNFIY